MIQLVPCPECDRHVRVDHSRCPFCEKPFSLRAPSPRPISPGRLGRAALVALGAAAVTVGAACGANPNSAPPYGGPPDDGYLVPPPDDSVEEGEPDDLEDIADGEAAPDLEAVPEDDSLNVAPAYGAPPPQE